VSNGYFHSCAIATAGTLSCWGDNTYGQQNSIPVGTFISLAAGHFHTCGIATGGVIGCWGDNSSGQLNNIPGGTFSSPVVAAGENQTCAIVASGSLSCWGDNSAGQASPPPGTFSAVAAGGSHGCALTSAGTLSCWGDNSAGQSSPPAGTFTAVTAGSSHSCAIATAGTLSCWGDNTYGQASPPAGTFIAVSAGNSHTCAISTAGTLSCWGDNTFSQLDNIPAGTFVALSGGGGHSCAIATGGTVSCWGDNSVGQLNNIPTGTFTALSAGAGHTCAIASGGTLSCWGSNAAGQLTNIPSGTFAMVSAGSFYTCALATSGKLSCWGENSSGQLGAAPKVPWPAPATPAPIGASYSFAFTSSSGNPTGRFSVDSTTLPPGLTLSPAGVLSGTPTTLGTFSFTVTVSNLEGSANASFSLTIEARPVVTAVTFTGSVSSPTLTIVGSGFGTKASLGSASSACDSGKTYGTKLSVADTTEGWSAGHHGDCVGLIVSSYTNTKVVLSFGSDYGHLAVGTGVALLSGGDSYTVSVLGATLSDTAIYLTSLSPRQLAVGASGPVTLTGSGFVAGAKVWVTGPSGAVKAFNFTLVNPTRLKATLNAPAAVPVGSYSVMINNGAHSAAACKNCLTVIAPPTLTSMNPSSLARGSSNVPVQLTGTGFVTGATLTGPTGASFTSVVIVSSTTITAKLTVSATAAAGTSLPVTVTDSAAAGYGKAKANLLTIT
jgi:alpha-tubulin suppressor-like RCC1 family protein